MTFIYIVFYVVTMVIIGANFVKSLESITVTYDDGSTREVDGLTNGSWVIILVAIVWTAFAFWFIASQSLAYVFYY
ncbi:putative D(1) dopamine receptor-like protein [Mammaliicoccus phage vB_MscM-PMS3]|nr:putative D(1) dopamine receptor-like protein [Mammaliicoccus phage vB_MscM-PMS3]